MVADETGRGPAASTTNVRLRWLAIVVAIMALLTAGWPLLNSAVANRQALASGARVTIGPSRGSSGTVTVGAGWYIQPAQSNPALEYVLRKGAIVLDIRHVSLIESSPADSNEVSMMWRGMRQILAVTDPGSSLGRPINIMTIHGIVAITGAIAGPGLIGTATIVPGPSRDFAIAMVALAPRRTSLALRAAARRVVLSLMFPALSR